MRNIVLFTTLFTLINKINSYFRYCCLHFESSMEFRL